MSFLSHYLCQSITDHHSSEKFHFRQPTSKFHCFFWFSAISMETPSSSRRVTRSQTLAAAAAANISATNISKLRKVEESETGLTKSRHRNNGKQHDRSALIDITNDSPIVGLAAGSLETPSALSKKRFSSRRKHDGTPGSGETLLRGQVKTLLQRVEEEAELSKLSLENRHSLQLQGFINSPLTLVAPTPANTPQILNVSAYGSSRTVESASFTQSPVEENFVMSQMVSEILEGKIQEGNQSQKNLVITRSLLLDFSEKLEGPECSSEVMYQGGESEGKKKETTNDDDSSIWSIQVNASTRDDQDEEDEEGLDQDEEEYDNGYFYDEEGEEKKDDEGLIDELCHAISKISVKQARTTAKFTGKHTQFVYNSDDELEGEEEVRGVENELALPSVLNLKGLPTPKGKHLRFPDD